MSKKTFTKLVSGIVPLPIDNIDTDQIIPARFLKATTRDGFGENLFCDWRKKYHSVEMHIVLGNHDQFNDECYSSLPLSVHKKEFRFNPFSFTHHPKTNYDGLSYNIAGHIHPVIKLTGKANQHFKFPCFYFGKQQAVLPSFGYFTGGYVIEPEDGDQVIAVVENKLVDASVFFQKQ